MPSLTVLLAIVVAGPGPVLAKSSRAKRSKSVRQKLEGKKGAATLRPKTKSRNKLLRRAPKETIAIQPVAKSAAPSVEKTVVHEPVRTSRDRRAAQNGLNRKAKLTGGVIKGVAVGEHGWGNEVPIAVKKVELDLVAKNGVLENVHISFAGPPGKTARSATRARYFSSIDFVGRPVTDSAKKDSKRLKIPVPLPEGMKLRGRDGLGHDFVASYDGRVLKLTQETTTGPDIVLRGTNVSLLGLPGLYLLPSVTPGKPLKPLKTTSVIGRIFARLFLAERHVIDKNTLEIHVSPDLKVVKRARQTVDRTFRTDRSERSRRITDISAEGMTLN